MNANGAWRRSDSERATRSFFSILKMLSSRDEFLDIPYQMALPISMVECEELVSEIAKLNVSKSPGYHGIDVSAIKALPTNGINLLLNIINKCFQLGHFLTQWKCAEIILIPKPGKPAANFPSYRPISLLAALSKVVVVVI